MNGTNFYVFFFFLVRKSEQMLNWKSSDKTLMYKIEDTFQKLND